MVNICLLLTICQALFYEYMKHIEPLNIYTNLIKGDIIIIIPSYRRGN